LTIGEDKNGMLSRVEDQEVERLLAKVLKLLKKGLIDEVIAQEIRRKILEIWISKSPLLR
jgi:hypothetical protein